MQKRISGRSTFGLNDTFCQNLRHSRKTLSTKSARNTWIEEQKMKHVIVGEVEGVQRNTKKKRKKSVNQKLSQWQFGQLLQYLEYKLKAKGIKLKKVNEAYSTQTCPVCTRRKKPSGRVYKCKCGYEQHRDIHGACNILTRELYGVFQPIEIKSIKYLRIS